MSFPYHCAACKAEVAVSTKGDISRSCACPELTPVIAERTCMLYGEGGAKQLSLAERIEAALKKLTQALRGA
jgi:hypothetical protein